MRVILDLCGGSGSWSRPYQEAGYQVVNVTLPQYDVREFIPPADVHGILAAPPCTHFSLARTRAKTPRDFVSAMTVVQACLSIIWKCRAEGSLKWWALENPRGYLRQFIGNPSMTFEAWQYGDSGIKPTDLWGYFNRPKASVRIRPDGLTQRFPNGRTNAVKWSKSAEKRAMTPAKFAQAFFKANP